MRCKLSVIIPFAGEFVWLERVIDALTRTPVAVARDVVIVDTTNKLDLNRMLSSQVFRERSSELKDAISIVGAPTMCYPGEARNLGVSFSEGEFIAFLDVKTHPTQDWIEEGIQKLNEGFDLVLGSTKYCIPRTVVGFISQFVYGSAAHETVPGSILKRSTFLRIGPFLENTRVGEDVEWKSRLSSLNLKWTASRVLTYEGLRDLSLSTFLRKWIVSSAWSANLGIYKSANHFGLLVFSVVIVSAAYNWNPIVGWSSSPYYLPHITKTIASALIFGYLISRCFWLPYKRKYITSPRLLFKFFLVGPFIFILLDALRMIAVIFRKRILAGDLNDKL